MSSPSEPIRTSFEPVFPDLNDWPIVKLSRDRVEFAKAVEEESLIRIKKILNGSLTEELERTLFLESIRMKEQHWDIDPPDEPDFWKRIKNELISISHKKEKKESNTEEEKTLTEIVSRYSKEISGKFNIAVYRLAQRVLPIGFYPLLNAPVYLNFLAKRSPVRNKIDFSGDLEKIRELSKTCTIVIVPTHSSNLDSVIVGWAIGTLGLPAFLYGAGQNLFGIRLFAFFMNYLGSYKVDRRKKNMIYLETLKTYSRLAIHRGCHSLFFSGGRRSRSGSLENKLKLGLLGTTIDAQYLNLLKSEGNSPPKKVILVPMVLNYHFVMEAPYLIDDYLKTTGKENYLPDENDKYSTSFELLKVIVKLFTKDTQFALAFGTCMDVFGNPVDSKGSSISHSGREINIRDYFLSHGELHHDEQRNAEYVRMLGDKIMKSFRKENTVFSSHIVTFAAFELLKKRYPKMDIYDLLRLSEEERMISEDEFGRAVKNILDELVRMKEEGKIKLAVHLSKVCGMDPGKIIEHGLSNAGIYHSRKVLFRHRNSISSEDLKLLYYYHNRLTGYSLEKYI